MCGDGLGRGNEAPVAGVAGGPGRSVPTRGSGKVGYCVGLLAVMALFASTFPAMVVWRGGESHRDVAPGVVAGTYGVVVTGVRRDAAEWRRGSPVRPTYVGEA